MTGRGLILAIVPMTGKEHLEERLQLQDSCCDEGSSSCEETQRNCVLLLETPSSRDLPRNTLQDVFPQVFVFHDPHEPLFHRFGIKHNVFVRYVREIKKQVFKQRGHHGV